MNNPLRTTTSFLGLYAGLLAVQHGIFEIMQGSRAPDSLMFNAIGPPCQAETVWHSCFPAMTLIPNLLITGIATVLIGVGIMVWAAVYLGRKKGGLVLGMFSLVALFVGGGFVPVYIGIIAAVAASCLYMPVRPGGMGWRIVSALWPWTLILMAFWLPGSWLLGFFFGEAMLAVSGLLFLIFDVSLPVLVAVSGFGREKRT